MKCSPIPLVFMILAGVSYAGERPPEVQYESFPDKTVYISRTHEKGLPSTSPKADMDTPAPIDFPANTSISIRYPKVSSQIEDDSVIVYDVTEVSTAPHKSIQANLALLKKLLRNRPTKLPADASASSGDGELDLPDYPASDCAHLFQAKLRYIDTPWGSGLGYLTVFCQDEEPPTNENVKYVFQGLSKDGKYYVSCVFHVTHLRLIKSFDSLTKTQQTEAGIKAFNAKAIKWIKAAPDAEFYPSLAALDQWIGSLKIQ